MAQLGEVLIGVRLDTAAVPSQLAALKSQLNGVAGTTGTAAAAAGGMAAVTKATKQTTRATTLATSSVRKLEKGLGAFAAQTYRWGRAATWRLSLPLAALGTVAVNTANTFEQTFAKIDAIAGNIGVPFDQAKEQVKDLAVELGLLPQDVAEGLYFIASAGLDASLVMSTLRGSAELAATGMGGIQEIAQILTTVMNNYAESGMTAAKAQDILTRAISLGKAEPEDYVQSLGSVVASASQLLVPFESVAAAIAQGTNAGLSAARAATGLRFIFGSLVRPTVAAKKVMDEYGLTVEELQATFSDLGAVGAIQYLEDLFDLTTSQGREAFATIMGGQRGLIIANALVGENRDSAQRIDRRMADAAQSGAQYAEEALDTAMATSNKKFEQLKARWKVFLIELGDAIVPVLLDDILPALQQLLDSFNNLSDESKKMLVIGGIFTIIAGPALQLLSVVARLGQGLAFIVRLVKYGTLAKAATQIAAISAASAAAGPAAAAAIDPGLYRYLTGAAAGTAARAGVAGGAAAGGAAVPLAIITAVVAAVLAAIDIKNNIPDAVDRAVSDLENSPGSMATATSDEGIGGLGFAALRGFLPFRLADNLLNVDERYLEQKAREKIQMSVDNAIANADIQNTQTEGLLRNALESMALDGGQRNLLAGAFSAFDRFGGQMDMFDEKAILDAINNPNSTAGLNQLIEYLRNELAPLMEDFFAGFENVGDGTGIDEVTEDLRDAERKAGDFDRQLQRVQDRINALPRTVSIMFQSNAGAFVDSLRAAFEGAPPGGGVGGQVGAEHGAVIGLARGGYLVNRPTFIRPNVLTGERNKTEAVVPLEDPRGRRALAGAMADALVMSGGGGSRGDVHVHVAGKVERPEDIKRNLDWWMRSRGL